MKKHYYSVDLTGRRFHRLVALYPTEQRSKKGSVIWHCLCDCGREVDFSYNELCYSNLRSCGCQKKEHDKALHGYLVHSGGTSIDLLRSAKLPTNNTSGKKGVYFMRGKWLAKIVFQKKAYYLGTYPDFESAAEARAEAEELLERGTVEHYERWRRAAEEDPEWARNNPICISVEKDGTGLSVLFLPELNGE